MNKVASNKVASSKYRPRYAVLATCYFVTLYLLVSCVNHSGTFDEMLDSLYSRTVPLLKAEELKMELADDPLVYLLDARERPEYERSHLEKAVYVGYNDFEMSRVAQIPKSATVVVYCSVGYRSERIGEQLLGEGYQKVYNLYGGIFDWKNKENPVYNDLGEPTDTVHVYSKKWGKWLEKGVKVCD